MSIRTRPAPRAIAAHITGRFRRPSRRFMIAWVAMLNAIILGIGITIQLVASTSLGAGL
jgi:hypothetical protein